MMDVIKSDWLQITKDCVIALSEIEFSAIRAQGPGGQNVNKVSSAIHLRFNIAASSLPAFVKERLLTLADQRITKEGVIVIKAQRSRSQENNKAQAVQRLEELVCAASVLPTLRKATRPTKSSQVKRVESKVKRGQDKILRKKMGE